MNPLSPGVYSVEKNLSLVVPRSSNSVGAFAGDFTKGLAGDYRIITNSSELEDIFGPITNANYNDWLQAKMYLDYSNKLYVSRAVDENGTWQSSDVLIATAINEPAVGAPAVNTVDISYSETDIIAGSWIRFVSDGNQQRYKVINFNETFAPVTQSDDITFGGVTFPLLGGEVFDITIDGTSVSYTGIAGDTITEALAGLDGAFSSAGINTVNFFADYINSKIVVSSLTQGLAGIYTISISAADTAGTVLSSPVTAMNGLATLTLDMEIVWDLIPGTPGSKQIITGANQLDYIHSIATNAFTEVKLDTGDFTPQVSEIQLDTGTYDIGDTIQVVITEMSADADTGNDIVRTVNYVIQDENPLVPTGTVENRAALIENLYAAIITSNPSTVSTTRDKVIGKVTLTSKYPGLLYGFSIVVTPTIATGTLTVALNTTSATDGTVPCTEAELFRTREIYLNKNEFDLEKDNVKFSTIDSKIKFISRWVGDSGNDIDITIAKTDDFNQEVPKDTVIDVSSNGVRTITTTKTSPILGVPGVPLDSLFEYVPAADEIAILISVKGEVKERYIVSLDETKKDYNNKSKYIENVINLKSNYVYAVDNKENTGMPESSVQQLTETTVEQYQVSTGQKIGKSVTSVTTGDLLSLVHGDSGVVRKDDLLNAYDVFKSVEEIEVDILIANEKCPKEVIELAEYRGDCIAYVGALYEQCVGLKSTNIIDNLVDYVSSVFGDLNVNSSYAAFHGNYLNVYSKDLDKNVWVNAAGAAAGLRAATNDEFDPWYASAGLSRGQINGVDKLAFIPNRGSMDILYKNSINPITSFPGKGNAVVYGQKTLLKEASAFDRVNVRGLFNVLKRNISKMALSLVFEINDEFTRKQFVEAVNPYLEYIQYNRGLQEFYVKCDSDNNPPAVIDANQFVGQIAVKPARVAEYIILEFSAVGTSVDFKEIFA